MNYERWKHLRDTHTPPHCMDWRHVLMINALLTHEKPSSVVEFGCWRGYSSSAVIEALEECPEIKQAEFYDPDIQPDLIAHHNPPRVYVHKKPSREYPGHAKCWLIDGDHWQGAIEDYKMARGRKAEIIVIHDTHSHYVMGAHDGSRDIGGFLQIEAKHTFLDCRIRPNEFTQRGLLIGWFKEPAPGVMDALRNASLVSL